jgi:hypothetical protein
MAESRYPLSKTKFKVEIQGMPELSGWLKVSGVKFGMQTSLIYDEHSGLPRNFPGKKMAGPIRLERMFDANDALAKWANEGARRPLNGSVIFLDYTGEEGRRFNWSGGYITLYELDSFDASPESEGTAKEIIEITVEDIFPG